MLSKLHFQISKAGSLKLIIPAQQKNIIRILGIIKSERNVKVKQIESKNNF